MKPNQLRRIRNANEIAYPMPMLAVDNETSFKAVCSSCTDENHMEMQPWLGSN
jgi:hypothetical protein